MWGSIPHFDRHLPRVRWDWSPTRAFLPNIGQEIAFVTRGADDLRVQRDPGLVAHVARTTGLSEAEATRVIDDVLDFHAEPVEAYVRRRHGELKQRGVKNPEIFALLREELDERVFAATERSERQLRRIVYG